MVQEIRSLQKLAIFFRVSRWGRRGGGGGGGGLYAVLYGTCCANKSMQIFFPVSYLYLGEDLYKYLNIYMGQFPRKLPHG